MEKRLLLDRIALHAAYIAPGDIEITPTVEAHLAHATLPLGNGAAVSAGKAAHPVTVQLFVKFGGGFGDVLVQDVAQGRHSSPQGFYAYFSRFQSGFRPGRQITEGAIRLSRGHSGPGVLTGRSSSHRWTSDSE